MEALLDSWILTCNKKAHPTGMEIQPRIIKALFGDVETGMLIFEVRIFTLDLWRLTLEVCRLTLEVWTLTTE
jgi:hypothetical protein